MSLRFGAKHKAGRQLFFPFFQLVVFVICSAYIMLLLYPKSVVFHKFNKPFAINNITLDYLNAILIENTGNVILVPKEDKMLSHQQKEKLFQQIVKILSKPVVDKKSLENKWFSYQVLRWLALSTRKDNISRPAYIHAMNGAIEALMHDSFQSEQLQQFADDALANNKPELSLKIYQKILDFSPNQSPTFFAGVASIALAAGKQLTAGKLYLNAFIKVKDINKKRKYFIDCIKSYLAGEQYDQVIVVLSKYGHVFFKDAQVLFFMSKTSLSVNKPELAKTYINQMLKISDQSKAERGLL